MAEELLGPELSATIVAQPEVRTKILTILSADDERLNAELEQSLWSSLTGSIQRLVSESGYNHDGFHFSWDLVTVYMEDDEIVVSANINANVKSDDFEFFEGLLQDEDNLALLLTVLAGSIAEFLLSNGVSKSSFSVSTESTGFGYG